MTNKDDALIALLTPYVTNDPLVHTALFDWASGQPVTMVADYLPKGMRGQFLDSVKTAKQESELARRLLLHFGGEYEHLFHQNRRMDQQRKVQRARQAVKDAKRETERDARDAYITQWKAEQVVREKEKIVWRRSKK